jgi:hypothetical protein
MRTPVLLIVTALALAGCSHGSSRGGSPLSLAAPATTPPPAVTTVAPLASSVVLQFGPALAPAACARIEALVRGATGRSVSVAAANASTGSLGQGSLVLAFGDTVTTRQLITAAEVQALPSEGYLLRSQVAQGVTILATDGVPLSPDPFGLGVNGGLLYGSYALLEELGFAFLHPLAPTIPPELGDATLAPVDVKESPRWPSRGIHIHTMHPIELCEVLNGWGHGDPADDAGFHAMLADWDKFLEWAIANRLNRVEWYLLAADSWRSFASSPLRQARLAEAVSHAHAWGIGAGVDVPLALQQQHAWYMVENPGTLASETAQIQARVSWLVACGYDFFATELGTSEFTTPDDVRSLAWLNAYAAAVKAAGKLSYCKAHCSTGQVAKDFTDPVSGGPLNFNFLGRIADPALGVMPHTVEHYSLDDPAPTYGNTDFGYMRSFLQEEAGEREVVWHPETAYWVSFDINVPLFLPIYAERRLHDLRLIAGDETAGRVGRGVHAGSHIQGQMTFSSGWEWGYWLNDVIAARASWSCDESEPSDTAAFEKALDPVVRVFGAAANDVRDAIMATVVTQQALLTEGRVNGVAPASVVKRNGIGYLEGWDTWSDVSVTIAEVPGLPNAVTQPEKLGLVDMRTPWFSAVLGDPDYSTEVEPLLAEMEQRLVAHAAAFDALRARVPAHTLPLLADLADAADMTALRATQIHGLYDFVQGQSLGTSTWRPRLQAARDALDQAQLVVARREAAYRVDPARIAAWRQNPTAYDYCYLWTVRSLQYWWRDEEKAVDAPVSPFVMNVINPIDVAFGDGIWVTLSQAARNLGGQIGLSALTNGLAAPSTEPVYPQGGLRSRP